MAQATAAVDALSPLSPPIAASDAGARLAEAATLPLGSAQMASAEAPLRKYRARYCTPHVKVPGEVVLTPSLLHFVPDDGHACAREFGPETYHVSIQAKDIMECGAVALPLEGRYDAQGNARILFFLQLHLRTLDGHTYRSDSETSEDAWRVVFRLRSREELYEVVGRILDATDAASASSPIAGNDSGGAAIRTCVPFTSLDCMAELDAVVMQLQRQAAGASPPASSSAAATARASPVLPSVAAATAAAATAAARRFSAASNLPPLLKEWGSFLSGPPSAATSSAPPVVVSSDSREVPAGRRSPNRRRKRVSSAESAGGAGSSPSRSLGSPTRLERVTLRSGNTPIEQTLMQRMLAECILDYLPVSLRLPGAIEWVLRYTPKAHGVSMSTLYRNVADRDNTIMIVQDSESRVFGGFAPASWEPKGKFYGSGEAFVFSFSPLTDPGVMPEMQVYPWTSANSYFMYSDSDLLAMGGGDGRHAFAIRNDLLHGLSSPTTTFGNPTLAATEEFVVRDVEIWSLEEVDLDD